MHHSCSHHHHHNPQRKIVEGLHFNLKQDYISTSLFILTEAFKHTAYDRHTRCPLERAGIYHAIGFDPQTIFNTEYLCPSIEEQIESMDELTAVNSSASAAVPQQQSDSNQQSVTLPLRE